MSLQEFINQWTGKPVDTDGVYPNQCMDLAHEYVKDVLGLPVSLLAHPSAYQVFTDFTETQYFDKITNTPTGLPQPGDLIIFGQQVGANGHICVYIEGDVNSFKSFDANWPTGSLPHIQSHSYNGVLGWLHPKTQPNDDALASCMADREKFWKERDDALAKVEQQGQVIDHLNSTINDKNIQIASLQSQVDALTSQLADSQSKYQTAQEQAVKVPDLEKQLTQALKDRSAAWLETDQIKETSAQKIAELNKQITNLTNNAPAVFFRWLVAKVRGGEQA